MPFGGVSLILLGDCMQLKPVSCFKYQVSLVIKGLTYLIQVIGHFAWMAPTVEEHEIRYNKIKLARSKKLSSLQA